NTERVAIIAEPTPNPNSIKFSVNRTLVNGAPRDFASPEAAKGSPLATELFLISGVKGVFIGNNFVTVSMAENVWSMKPLVEGTIETHLAAGKAVIDGEAPPQAAALPANA